jgi:Spy/CpxP family protein refolding chaperone
MFVRLVRRSILPLTAIALSSAIALSQQAPTQPAPPAPGSAPAAAPVERHPPSRQMRPGMRGGMMQGRGNGPGGFSRTRMMHKRGNFRGGPGGFHGPRGAMGMGMGMSAGMHMGPPGMWWKNPMMVQRLSLTADQTKRMDDIFQKSRLELIDLRAKLETQNALLEPLISANPVDSAKALAQIDKVAQARADLEKADARMLLGIRGVLTPDQWTKLNDRRGPGDAAGPGGAAQGRYGQGGYGGGGGYGPRGGQRGGGQPPANDLVAPPEQP